MENTDMPPPLIDASHFQTMHDVLGEDFESLIGEFFADYPRFSNGLISFAGAGNTDSFRELCHELKGASALLGLSAISAYAAMWETMANEGKLPDGASIQERLGSLLEETRKLIAAMP